MQTILFTLRRKAQKPILAIVLAAMALTSGPVSSEAFFWDTDTSTSGNDADGTGLGGSGTWDTTTGQWWDLSSLIGWPNSGTDQAIFTYAYPGLGIPVQNTVTVDAGGVNAGRISFLRSGYTLSGGAITLAGSTPTLHATLGDSVTISSNLLGTAGLTKNGGGSIRLSGDNSGLTGPLAIANGTLIISNPLALPGTGAVSILTNNETPLNTTLIGLGGGSLVLDGTAGGFTFARDVDFEGRGPIGDRGAAIQSLGNNTLSGILTSAVSPLPLSPTATIRNSRINSVNGTLTLSGTVVAGGTAATTFLSLGGVNSAGVGNFTFGGTGALTGTGSIEKSGGGTLFLNSLASNAGFTGTVRISGSVTGQQSSVRVTDLLVGGNNVFGGNTGTNASSTIDMNGGVLEFRNNGDLNFNALSSGKNVYLRANSTFYTGPAAGGSAINGLTTLGTFRVAANTTATYNSRNGYGMTLGAWTQESSTANTAIANSMGGTLTFTGDAWNNADASARNLTFSGDGNTRLVGSITATGTNKQLVKQGTGELIINGVASTFTGNTSVQAGTVRITDFRSLFNGATPGTISLGNAGTTAGNLIIGGTGAGTGTIAGLTTSKPILFNSTTGQSAIYANQPGVNPVILNGAITSITTTGNYNFGGSNTADNIINTALPLAGAASGLTKVGSGTWVLNAANLYTGATNIQNGTLKLRATGTASDVIANAGAITFSVQATAQTAGGTLEFRGSAAGITTETLGALTPTAGASTVRLLGQGGFASNLTFTSLGATAAASSVNFDTTGANGGVVTLTGQGATTATNLPGTANFLGHLYINGANFAATTAGGVVEAPTYGGAGNFRDAGPALVAATHNRLTAATASGALTISSLLTNSQTLTLSGNLVVSTGGILQSGGTATIQSDSGTARLIQGAAAATNVAIRVDGENDVLNIGSATNPVNISSVTTGGLTKNGAGELVFFGTNAQTGTVTINEGTVELNGTNARLAALAGVATVVRQNAFLDFNTSVAFAANPTVAALDGSGTIRNIGSADVTLVQTGAGTWAGSFNQTGSGVLNVSKLGTTGAPIWQGLSNYTGVTTIGGTTGLVTVDHMNIGGQPSGIGASTSAASNLVFSGTSSGLVYRGSIIDTALTLGSRSATTDRLFTLSGSGATLSSTVTNNNAIVWSNTGAIVHGVTGPQSLVFTGTSTGDNTFNPQLTNSTGFVTSLTKTAAGQWNLGNSNNTYTGLTTVGNGILALNDNGALPTDSPLALGTTTTNGILQTSGSFARNLTTTPTAGTGTITWTGTTGGGGFAAHTTALTVTLDGGAGLTWGSGGFVGTGGTQSLIFNSASALADVTFTNDINLGTANRTITVNDNVSTGADYATVSGVLSSGAGGGLLKNGTGILRLGNANTYTGLTQVQAGTLVVSSLGSSTGGGSSSVGLDGVAMDNTNAIQLGAGGNNAGILQYVGAGETSDRKIRFNSTTGTSSTNQIHADGSGALILTNVANDMTAGAKSVVLRGSNTAGNMITSQLSDNGGALTITVDGGATWILTNSANNYTGNTNANAGALGIGHDTALGAGTLVLNNGNVFAYGGDRTIANAITHANNTSAGFLGDYSLTFNGILTLAASTSNVSTTTNSIVTGKALTFNGGIVANAITATRAWAFDGPGETVLNGDFTTSTAFGINITKNGNGTLTLGTNGATSNWNQANNALDLDRGTLRFTADNAIPTLATSGGLTISPELATADTATVDLNGTTQTVNALTATTNGTLSIDNTAATAATFRFGANNTNIAFGGTTLGTVPTLGSYTITDSGAGALSIVKLGNTSTTFGSHVVLTHQGTTSVEGGTLNIAANLNGTTGLLASNSGSVLNLTGGATLGANATVSASAGATINASVAPVIFGTNSSISATGASTLNFTGGITNPNLITSVEVGGGSTLSLLDGAGSNIANLTTLNLGNTGAGTVTLNLNVGDLNSNTDRLNTDTLTLLTGNSANLGNTITFNLTDAGLNANQTYTLLNLVDGGITAFGLANMIQGATPGGFDSFTWNVTNNLVQLTTGNLLLNDLYWRGSTDNTWNANVNNWSLLKDGTGPDPDSIPGQGNEVIFAWDNPGAGALVTTLEQNFKINSLVFEAGATTTPSSVEINPGALATARLEIAPQAAADGITLSAGGPAAVTIGANLRLGADQTWTTASGTLLTIGGALFGEADVTKAGDGRVVLSAAADPTFNAGQTATFTVNAGTLEMTNLTALGSLANSNVVPVTINSGGAFYYNNAVATTAGAPIANAITLGGGTLSLGGANHFIGPVLTVNAASTINLRDSNSATLTTTARALTLNNGLTGTGNLTVDSQDDGTAINQILGTLTLNQDNSAWSGDLTLLRGSITTNNANGLGSGDNITIEKGRITLAAGAGTPTIAQNITIARAGGAAIGEFSLGNGVATTFSGVLTLGGAGGTGELRVFGANDAATATFTGGVVLANNGLIGVRDAANRLLHIDSVISETGGPRTLRINDGVWGGTAGTVRLTGANTFTGDVTVARGILEFDTITNAGGAASSLGQGTAITMTGGTLRFIGSSPQTTDRPITTATGAVTLSANGATATDTITYTGAITVGPTGDGSQLVLAGAAGSAGIITGGFTQTGTTADATVSGGNWTLSGAQSTVADDFVISGTNAVLNLDSTGVVRLMSGGAGADLTIRNGGVVNVNAINAVQYTGSNYRLFVGQGGDGADAVLNLNANLQSGRFILGERGVTRVGIVNGPGTLTVDNAAATFITLMRGEINANIASNGTGAGIFLKAGSGTVTLRGDNSGLTNTGITQVDNGILVLDYTLNNASKLNSARQLDMRGSTLQIIGNASAATTQNVLSFTMASGAGNNIIDVTAGTGQDATLSLGVITRAASAGTLRINLNNAGAAVTTSTLNTNGILGLAGYTTVKGSTGTWFGTNSTNLVGGSIVALASTLENSIPAWTNAAHISDSGSGFTGTVSANHLSSLRFDAAGGSALSFAPGGVLTIASGGILVTDQVTSGSPGLFGGTLGTGVTEIIVTQDSSQVFEISSRIGVNNAFTNSGPGTVLLSGNNASTGAISIQNGVLQLAGGNAIGDTSLVTLATNRNTTLQLLASETIGRLQGGQRATNSDYGTVAVGSHTLTLNQSAGTTFSGLFTGNGAIVMAAGSVGTLNMNNSSTGFTGTVTVNGGLFQLSGIGRNDASAFTINGPGALLLDKNSTTNSGTQILDSASIALNSAVGNTATLPYGIWFRRDTTGTVSETVGTITAASGTSYIRGESTATGAVTVLSAGNLVRNNSATLVIRGGNMAATADRRAQFRIIAANEAAFIGSMIGGAGAAGSVTTSIVPWAIGEDVGNAAVGSVNMGNSLVTYTATTGFRPLNLSTEYALYATAGATNNTRESLAADSAGLLGRTLNSLVINNQAVATPLNVTGDGAGQALTNTSGAFLFTLTGGANSTAYQTNLGGFGDGIATPSGEYIFHVVNPSAAATTPTLTATVSSNLTSAADITKSGRGTLILSGTNTAGGVANKTTLNEGILEIANLVNIGGGTGGLVFAGGTLRLGVGFTDDISSRSISFLTGGGTLDTNGIDLTLANSLGSGVGGFTKAGAGNLTLNASATYTGNSVLALGTVTVGANNALGNGGNLTLAAGTTLALGTSSLTHGLVTTSGASPNITGTGTITAAAGFFLNHTGNTAIEAILAGTGGLLKAQTNIVTLTGLNTYTGTTEVRAGGLSFDSIGNVGGGASALGTPGNVEDGIIRMGLTTTATSLTYTGSGHISDRLIGMQGTTGGLSLFGNGAGAVGYGGVRFETPGNKTLTLRGSSDPSIENLLGAIREVGGVLTVNKSDGNTWFLNQQNTYSGATQVDNGILRLGVDDALPVATALRLGTGSTAGTLDLNGFDQTVGSLVSQTNSASVTNTLIVDAGNTLTVNGAVTIGANVAAGATTLFTATGGGDFVNNNTGGTFQIGGGTGGTNTNAVTADFSALANFTVDLGPTGTFRVGDSNSNSSGSPSSSATLILASTSASITAGTINLGQGTGQGAADQALKLGAGTNELNADIINIGGNTTRSGGSLEFAGATGSVVIRGSDGVSAANVNMVNGAVGTGIANQTDFLLAGHSADVLINAMVMAAKSTTTGATTANLTFDEGTLGITSLLMTSNTGSYSGTATSNVSIGGGTATVGALNMAVNTSSGAGNAVANFNVTAGDVTIGTGSGTAVNMANAATGRTATSNLNLTGGTVEVTGDIIRSGGAGTENATVTLNGATLDMTGNDIGSATNQIVFNTRSGTLRNLGELNGGGALEKTTAGILILDTANSYTGATTVTAGVLRVSHGGALGGTAVGTTVADGAALELAGDITTTNEALALNGSGVSGGGALRNVSGNNTYAGNITLATATRINSDAGLLTLDATTGAAIVAVDQNLTLGGAGNITVTDAITLGTGNLVKEGAGTVILSGDNSYSGTTTVSDGLLQINGNSSLATGAVSVASGATLGGSGTIGGVASTATIASGGTITGGSDGSSMTVGVLDPLITDAVGTLTFGGNLTASSGSIWLVDLVQGGTADLINVGGGLDITGANLAINFGGAFVENQVYTIANYGTGLTGSFAGLSEGAFVDPGNLYRINYGTGPSGAITLTAVPEPGTLGFLGLALGGFFVRRIRRRRAAAAAVSEGRD